MVVRDFRRCRRGIQDEDTGVTSVGPIQGSYTDATESPARVFVDSGSGVLHGALHYDTLTNFVTRLSDSSTGGVFPNAHGFVINNSTITNVERHGLDGEFPWFHNSHNQRSMLYSALKEMLEYIIAGTEFDSSSRDDPPRCHPDTRTRFLEELKARIEDATLGTKIVWLFGPAGVGKSAIMQSLVETVHPLPSLTCATLFFSRPNHRDDPMKVFTTLAYGFAEADEGYRRYMKEGLAADPRFLDKTLHEQFKRLFITPFTTGRVSFGSRRWVVFLDGFDEINGEDHQRRILNIIRESLLPPNPTMPLVWIIASRPEAHLQTSFRQVERQITHFWKLEVPIDSDEALRSVELYLRTEFAKIREEYSDVVSSSWPPEVDFLELTKASSGLFIFATTLVDYVGKENPVRRLKHILSLICRRATDHNGSSRQETSNPFHALDVLYSTIMSDIPSQSFATAKYLLAYYLQDNPYFKYLQEVCNFLGLEQDEVYSVLRKLHSVLKFPPPDEAFRERIHFLHASFSDFLKDPSRSQSHFVDLNQEHLRMWRRYGSIVKLAPVRGKCFSIVHSPEMH